MQAIILAAGMGRRLGELTKNDTKCMLQVNGIRLIDRTLEQLSQLNISRVVMVVGYSRDNVKKYLGDNYHGLPIVYVDNEVYATTNNIYSLFLAKDYMAEDDTLLLESDLIYEKAVLDKIVHHPYPNLALVDKYESWMDGTVVTLNNDYRIQNFITKDHFRFEEISNYYKTVNIYKFSKSFSEGQYIPFLEAYCKVLGKNEYYEQVLKVITMLNNSPLKALPLSGEKWYEIDDIQDLDIAQGMFAESDEAQWQSMMARYGGYWRYPHLKDFCYLVNPYYPTPRMIDEMMASFNTLIREYPSGMGVNSLLASKNFGVKQSQIVVGNGAAELIKALMENYSGRLGVTMPTFEEYPNRKSESEVVRFIPKNKDYHYTADDLMVFFADKHLQTLLIINPDNPSGNYIPYSDLLRLIDWAKNQQITLVIDESFVDFADVEGQYSLLDDTILSHNPHLVVIKSISKSYGVPGLRLGVLASGNTDLIAKLKKDVAIWNINSFGEFYMQIAEKYHGDYLQACQQFKDERKRFLNRLQEVPYLRVIPSQANYFLCEVLPPYTSRGLAINLLKKNDLLIKDCSSKKAFQGKNYIRIAIRDQQDNDQLVEALIKIK